MSDLNALLAGIVAEPANALRWLVMADWLEENGFPERAELVRVHRELLRTCTATRETKARKQLHARMMELMRSGVQPCLPQRTITLPGGVEMRFSFIPPGSFLMGSPKSEKDRFSDERRHLVTLTKGFWMGLSPITQRQWKVVMEYTPSQFQGDELPVETVSWHDARAYCVAAKGCMGFELRLPTEAEWEYASRGGTTTPFYWGGELTGMEANCDGRFPSGTKEKGPFIGTPTLVGSYSLISPHPWELVDVIGNVAEFTEDWYDNYQVGKAVDPMGPGSGSFRVSRGGDWRGFGEFCRTACRGRCEPDARLRQYGFRVAADLSALA